MREQFRERLVPLSEVIGVAGTLWGVVDFASPLLGVPGLLLVAGLMCLAAAWCFWHVASDSTLKRFKRLGLGCVLMLAGAVTAGASALNVDQGGVIASSIDKARDVQTVLFDLQSQVARVQQGVDQANQTLSRIDQRTEDLGTAGATCSDFLCVILEGAPVQRYEALKARGVDPRTVPLQVASRLAEESMPHSADGVRFMVANGVPGGINEALFVSNWGLVFQPQSFAKPSDRRAIVARSLMRQLRVGPERQQDVEQLVDLCANNVYGPPRPELMRWLDVAALHGNKPVVQQLLAMGADPKLPIPFCVNFRQLAQQNFTGYERFRDLLARAPDLHLTAQEFLD